VCSFVVLGVATQSHLFHNVFECWFKGFRSLRPPNTIETYEKLMLGANTFILYVFQQGFRSLHPQKTIETYEKLMSGANTFILYVFQ
jgi:hypothetical protein